MMEMMISNMNETKLLLILNDGNDDLYKVDITNSSSQSLFFSKKGNNKLSSGAIAAIILSLLLTVVLVISLSFIIKKSAIIKIKKNKDENESRVNLNII